MSTETIAPPAAPAAPSPAAAAPAAAPKAPNPSPKSVVPPVRPAEMAIKENISKVWGPDPSKAPAATPAAAEPATAAEPPAIAPAPEVIESTKKPDPAPAAAPVEVQHPEDKLAEPATEAAKAGWKELKAIAKTERARATALEQQIADLKKAPATASNTVEIEALRTELTTTKEQAKAAMDRLMILDLQNHPDFHKQYSAPKKAALDTAKEVIAYNGKESPELSALLAKPLKDFNAEVSALTEKMNPADASTVMQSLRQAREIHAQEQGALSKAGEVHQQLQQRSAQTQRQAFESVVGDALPKFKKMEITETMDAAAKETATKYNQSIDGLRARAEAHAFGKIDEKGTANLALKAVALEHMVEHAIPAYERALKDRNALIAAQNAELIALRGGRAPNVANADAAPAAPQNESIEAAAKRTWNRT